MMDRPKAIAAAIGAVSAWFLITTILDLRRGVARIGWGHTHSKAQEPKAFWYAISLKLICSVAAIVAAVGVIFFDCTVKS